MVVVEVVVVVVVVVVVAKHFSGDTYTAAFVGRFQPYIGHKGP